MIKDTIAAISTGMTNSGIGKVRLSGSEAIEIVDKIYRSPQIKSVFKTHRAIRFITAIFMMVTI